jgi:hypothetical protein
MNDTIQSIEPTKKSSTKKTLYIAIGLMILFAIIGNSALNDTSKSPTSDQSGQTPQPANNESTDKKSEQPAAPEKLTPQITVTSANISKEYSENEVAADDKYKSKIIEISGKITGIDNGSFDNEMIIKLADGKYDFSGPWCYMKASEKEKVLAFKKGQQVTLIGKGESATMGSPILKDCVVK